MQLYQQYRPASFADVVGQDKVLAKLAKLRSRGLAGRTYWITGGSGSGKTTIARILAAEVADDWQTVEYDTPRQLTVREIDQIRRDYCFRPLGGGACIIVNESHGLRRDQIERLLGATENAPEWVTWIFTTTNEGSELFDDLPDAGPFGSRTIPLNLARRGLSEPFAVRCREIATQEGINGKPLADYVKLAKRCGNNLRRMIQAVDAGDLDD